MIVESKIVGMCFLAFILIACLFVISSFLTGCDIRENAIMREQSDIFTEEIRDKNSDLQLLANQLKVANEENKKLELMLMCRDEITDKAVQDGKKELLKTIPVILPKKSNKAEAERNQ